jgi:threonylcarbamoyladenosine tRNA methylthiotransferase MtaB
VADASRLERIAIREQRGEAAPARESARSRGGDPGQLCWTERGGPPGEGLYQGAAPRAPEAITNREPWSCAASRAPSVDPGERTADGGPRRPRVGLVALGCRVSHSDLEALAEDLAGAFEVVGGGEVADYVVVSTCTVTADADAAARQAIRSVARKNPAARIVAAGCYAEVAPAELRALPGVAAVIGARSGDSVPEVLRALHRGGDLRIARSDVSSSASRGGVEGEGKAAAGAGEGRAGERAPPPFGRARAHLKVQDGCDSRCSYCAVPLARGPARSLPFEEALARIAALGSRSPEVVLAGVHLGAYGRDLAPRRSLAGLVAAAADRGLARRVRLSSVEPNELPVELFLGPARAMLCEHVHLPLQSGSARVLAAMRRPYSPSEIRRTVEELASAVPGICLGADLMTGFPGETERDHRATLEVVRSLPLAYLHVFPFSPRRGTAASDMPGQVPAAVARERARELRALSERRWRAYAAALRRCEVEVVVERVGGGLARGTARRYATVRWPWSGERRGELVRVRVEAVEGEALLGRREGE